MSRACVECDFVETLTESVWTCDSCGAKVCTGCSDNGPKNTVLCLDCAE